MAFQGYSLFQVSELVMVSRGRMARRTFSGPSRGVSVGMLGSLCPSGNVTEGHLVLTCQQDHPGH